MNLGYTNKILTDTKKKIVKPDKILNFNNLTF